MGEVFLVDHVELGRQFVAKVMHAELVSDARIVDRMRVERQALGRLNHPHIVSVIDSAKLADERPFIVMERLRGQTLADELQVRGRLPVYEAVRFSCQLLSALSAAHAIGIVHRDVKPANLFLCTLSDGSRVLKVLDFGVARVLPGAPPVAPLPLALPTDSGVLMGTPRYASPEAAAGSPVDARADLYAAALMLYVMLAGRGPFDHHDLPASLLAAHVYDEPEAPSKLASEPVPFPLDRAVLRGLRKDPAQRFQTAAEFRTELEATIVQLRRPLGWVETTSYSSTGLTDFGDTDPLPVVATEELALSALELETTTKPFASRTSSSTERPRPRGGATLSPRLGWRAFALPFVLGVLAATALAGIVRSCLGL
jgi:serine/threonine-protein kinase